MYATEWFTVEVQLKNTKWIELGKCHDTLKGARMASASARNSARVRDVRIVNTQVYRRVVEPPEQIVTERTDADPR